MMISGAVRTENLAWLWRGVSSCSVEHLLRSGSCHLPRSCLLDAAAGEQGVQACTGQQCSADSMIRRQAHAITGVTQHPAFWESMQCKSQHTRSGIMQLK